MIGIYLSGTGNTKHCVEKLVSLLDATAECIPLEAPHITSALEKQGTIILGYRLHSAQQPFYGSAKINETEIIAHHTAHPLYFGACSISDRLRSRLLCWQPHGRGWHLPIGH